MIRALAILLGLAMALPALDLGREISRLLDGSRAVRSAFWGIQIVDLEKDSLLFDLNSGKMFVPASNTKLFTTALGLMRLGANYRFETLVLADQELDASGRLARFSPVGGARRSESLGQSDSLPAGARPGRPLGTHRRPGGSYHPPWCAAR